MIDITTLDLLKYMGQRPPMYIGKYDIFSLKAFLDGLAFQPKSEDEGLVFLQQVFYPWLKEKYALEEEQLWAQQLSLLCDTQEEAVHFFFTLFDECYKEYTSGHIKPRSQSPSSKVSYKEMTTIELMELIRENPSAYLSKYGLRCFNAFLGGWDIHQESDETDEELLDFEHWIQKRYSIFDTRGTIGILELVTETEGEALDKFFELWDIFRGKITEAPIELTPKQQEVKQRFIQGLQEVFRKGYDPEEIGHYTRLFSYDNCPGAVALRDIIAALYWFSEEKKETFVQLVQKHLGIDIYQSITSEKK